MAKKTFVEKVEKARPAQIEIVPPGTRQRPGKMLIPNAFEVEKLVRKVRKGRLATQSQLRERLAKDGGADYTCPLTTGIFLWLISGACDEDPKRGTPYWRIIKDDGSLDPRFANHAEMLRAEGHNVEGRKLRVVGFEGKLETL